MTGYNNYGTHRNRILSTSRLSVRAIFLHYSCSRRDLPKYFYFLFRSWTKSASNSRERGKLSSPPFLLLQITSSATVRSRLLLLLYICVQKLVPSNAMEGNTFIFLRFRFIYINIFYDYYFSVAFYTQAYTRPSWSHCSTDARIHHVFRV